MIVLVVLKRIIYRDILKKRKTYKKVRRIYFMGAKNGRCEENNSYNISSSSHDIFIMVFLCIKAFWCKDYLEGRRARYV